MDSAFPTGPLRGAVPFRLIHFWLWITFVALALGVWTPAWSGRGNEIGRQLLGVRLPILLIVAPLIGFFTSNTSRAALTCCLAIAFADLAWLWSGMQGFNLLLLGVPIITAAATVRALSRALMIAIPIALLYSALLGGLGWILVSINHRPGLLGTGLAQAAMIMLAVALFVVIVVSTCVIRGLLGLCWRVRTLLGSRASTEPPTHL